MEYNTQKQKLILPEYGRNVQKMVDHLLTIENIEQRTKAARAVIDVMGSIYPHLRDIPDFRHKLWDHLAIMSNFGLNIETPYPLPEKEEINARPQRVPYKNNRIRLRHYGASVQLLADKIKELENIEEKKALIVLTANHMKKSFITWNNDSVEDDQILADMKMYLGDDFEFPEGFTLSSERNLVQKKSKSTNQNNRSNTHYSANRKGSKPNNNNSNYNKGKKDNWSFQKKKSK